MKRGFTLVEQVMVIVIIGFISLVFAVFIREGTSAWIYLSSQKNIALSTRSALLRVVREIKRMDQSSGITVCTSTEISFADIDHNVINFKQTGTQLLRNGQVLLDNLQESGGLTFQSFDNTGIISPNLSQISLITCRLVVTERNNRFALMSAAAVRTRRLK